MHPILLQIGPLTIRWYGTMIALACMAGLFMAGKEAERKGIDRKKIQDFFLYAIIGAVLGARLYYLLFFDGFRFLNRPLSIFALWEGGLAIHGAILGGLLVAILYTKRHHLSFWLFADTLAPSLILGQAIGRIGCFLNGDAHGYPTDLPWGLVFPLDSPAGQMFPGQALHPTQLYEMILNFAIFAVLWKVRRSFKVDGYLFLLYVVLYSAIRIFVEHFRADQLTYWGHISTAQSIGIAGVIMSFMLMFWLKRERSKKA